jgi:hypothetical protein
MTPASMSAGTLATVFMMPVSSIISVRVALAASSTATEM